MTEMRYVRKGKCGRCGKCCLGENCEHLRFEGDVAVCGIYGSPERPDKCKLFPEMPPLPFEGCGYWFEDTYEGNRVVRGIL
jgi:hypothetical protein